VAEAVLLGADEAEADGLVEAGVASSSGVESLLSSLVALVADAGVLAAGCALDCELGAAVGAAGAG